MSIIKLTSKRQASFPSKLCGDLGVEPGDRLEVKPASIDGQLVWTIRPIKPTGEWIGSLEKYAKNKSHRLEDIRDSITKGRIKDEARRY